MDVKGRARARAADLRDQAGAMTVQLRSSAAQAGHAVHDRASHAGHVVEHNPPEPVRSAVRRPRPMVVVGAAVGAVIVVGVLRRRRHGR